MSRLGALRWLSQRIGRQFGRQQWSRVARAQSRRTVRAVAVNGELRELTLLPEDGMAIHAVGDTGLFVSIDSLSMSSLESLMDVAGNDCVDPPAIRQPMMHDAVAVRLLQGISPTDEVTPARFAEMLIARHEHLRSDKEVGSVGLKSTLLAVDEEWRICRDDGTDVHFNVWRTLFANEGAVATAHGPVELYDSIPGDSLESVIGDETFDFVLRRLRRKSRMLMCAWGGERLPVGSYNVVLDSALTRGLAHEAIGHPAESDRGLDGSVLTSAGKYRFRDAIAAPGLTIVDGPVTGDWADQPFGANGGMRKTVEIIKDGCLAGSLADEMSGPLVGAEASGAERAERFDCVPLPRMSCIRLLVEDTRPLSGTFGLVEGEELYRRLLDEDLVSPEEPWLVLEGYQGGQVNSITGDFVFNCMWIQKLHEGRVTVHPPSILSGRVLDTLPNIVAAVGPVWTRSSGVCGKEGQWVPTSGGAALFTLIRRGDGFRVGG